MRRKIDIHVGLLDTRHGNGESLELSSGQMGYISVQDVVQLEFIAHLLLVIQLQFGIKHLRDGQVSLDGFRDVIDILRLDQGFEIVFQHFGEVVLQLGTTEVFQDFLPVGWVLKDAKEGKKDQPN